MNDQQTDESSVTQPQNPSARSRTTIAVWVGLAVVCLAVVSGLNILFSVPELVPVTGRVLYQGKTLSDGFVMSSPTRGGESALSGLDKEGRFDLFTNGVPGASVGTHRFVVRAYTRGMPPTLIIPGIYISAETTPLTIVVKKGARNHFEFDLKASPAK